MPFAVPWFCLGHFQAAKNFHDHLPTCLISFLPFSYQLFSAWWVKICPKYLTWTSLTEITGTTRTKRGEKGVFCEELAVRHIVYSVVMYYTRSSSLSVDGWAALELRRGNCLFTFFFQHFSTLRASLHDPGLVASPDWITATGKSFWPLFCKRLNEKNLPTRVNPSYRVTLFATRVDQAKRVDNFHVKSPRIANPGCHFAINRHVCLFSFFFISLNSLVRPRFVKRWYFVSLKLPFPVFAGWQPSWPRSASW